MAPRTRYFLIGSVLIVAVGVGTGLVAYYGGALPRRTAGLAEFAYVPAEATAVAFANVRGIMDSEFRQRLRQLLPTGQDKEKLQAETGIDIERDIDTVVAGMTGTGPADGGSLVMLRGRFDVARIEALATQHGATPEEYRKIRVLKAPEAATGVARPGGSLLLRFSRLASSRSATSRRSKRPLTPPRTSMASLKTPT